MSRSSAEHEAPTPWRRVDADGSITLEIHAQPGSKRTEVVGLHGGCLKIRIAAAAVEGEANDALVAFLAASFGVPRRKVTFVRGESARRKTLSIASPALRPDREWALQSPRSPREATQR